MPVQPRAVSVLLEEASVKVKVLMPPGLKVGQPMKHDGKKVGTIVEVSESGEVIVEITDPRIQDQITQGSLRFFSVGSDDGG